MKKTLIKKIVLISAVGLLSSFSAEQLKGNYNLQKNNNPTTAASADYVKKMKEYLFQYSVNHTEEELIDMFNKLNSYSPITHN
jgi:hypothetical protein